MTEPNSAAAQVGPGLIYWAPLGTAEPTTPTGSLDAAWAKVGFTETGSQLVINKTYTDLNVAEQLDPIRIVASARTIMFEFNMVEMTATNLLRVLNGGTIGASGIYTTFVPQVTGVETRAMLLWISDDQQEMIILRQVVQVGTITRQSRKAALATYTAQFRAEIPATGQPPVELWALTAVRA
jgi:hypothetical protein